MAPSTKKQKKCNVSTFIVDGFVVTSPNAGPLKSLPPPETLSFYDDPDPSKSFSLNWSILDYPFLAFVISPPRYDHPLLQRLDYTYRSLPIEPHWKLAPSLASSWEVLEDALCFIIHKVLGAGNQLYPLEFSVFHVPRSYGYLRIHRSESLARKCAIRSRDAFGPLMALCSSVIAVFHGRDLPPDVEPRWVTELQGPGGLNPTWLQLFRSSPIPNFSGLYPRVGTVIDACTWRYAHLTRIAINAGVPVWFCWSKLSNPLLKSPVAELEMYFPTRDQVMEAARTCPLPVNTSTDTVAHTTIDSHVDTADASTLAASLTFPEPHPESRQRRGETPKQFFDRLAIRHNAVLESENETERTARLAREAHARKFAAPGRKGARVFHRQDVNGFLVRRPVNRGEVEDLFEDTPIEHMRYNAFDNEWDICEEFNPTAQVDDTDPFGNDVHEYEEPGEIPEYDFSSTARQGIAILRQAVPPAMEVARRDIFAMFGHGVSHSADAAPTFVGSLDYQLYLRFGFDGEETQQPTPEDWPRILNYLQDPVSQVQDTFKPAIAHFVTSLLNKSVDNMSDMSWDISPTSLSSLRDRMGHYLLIDVQEVEALDSTARKDKIYLLRQPANTNNNGVHWVLAVASPAAALQCVRFCSSGVTDVVRFCVGRGIAFNTFAPVLHPQHCPPVLHNHLTLGACRYGYKPDAADYAAYEAARDRFLQSSSARAALLKGGIVWRLAMEFVTPGAALAGPSDIASTRGRVIHISGVGNFCDDELSEDESDLICGVYRVSNGPGKSATHLSWWPKQAYWEHSLYNVGCWTPSAESWFQKRLTEIRSNDGMCRTAAEWKKVLPTNGKSLKLARTVEKAAKQFIEGL